jgi:hypothetical protein
MNKYIHLSQALGPRPTGSYSPNLPRRNYLEQQQQQQQQQLPGSGEGPMWTSSPMPHLFPHPLMSRMTNPHGQVSILGISIISVEKLF